jgi:hypothetical protein
MHIAPSAIFASYHANVLGDLSEPNDTINDGAERHAGPIASLVSVLVVRTLRHAFIGRVLSEKPGHFRTGDNTNGLISGEVAEESCLYAIVWSCGIEARVVEALWNAGAGDVVGPLHIGSIIVASC